MSNSHELRGFCAAPWVEAVLYQKGDLLTCCRNGTVFGNWQKEGVENVWKSESFQNFRKSIINGKFPDESCKKCYYNGTARSLHNELSGPFHMYKEQVAKLLNKEISELSEIEKLFRLRQGTKEAEDILRRYFFTLDQLESHSSTYLSHIRLAVYKLRIIGRITRSFLKQDPIPKVVAPFRQVNLISKCNARCIHCIGRFTGEIVYGPKLDEKYIQDAFYRPEDMIDFFMNGSEFLFYKDWKKIAEYLVENGIKLSISTNGILLTPDNIRYLIDKKIVKNLNISLDGATREISESIRINIDFAKLMENIKFLFSYASAKDYNFLLSISFVLMKRNYHEFPKLVRLIHRLRGRYNLPKVNVYCQALENFELRGYRDFVHKEHHSLIDTKLLKEMFLEVRKESIHTDIPVSIFYSTPLEEFIRQGCSVPPLMISKPQLMTISDTSPSLASQKGIYSIDPADHVVKLPPDVQNSVTFLPKLTVPDEDKNKCVNLYFIIEMNNTVYVAASGGPFGVLTWTSYTGPLQRIVLCESIPSFSRVSLSGKLLAFDMSLTHIDLREYSGPIDFYYGYATMPSLSDFVGSVYRVILE